MGGVSIHASSREDATSCIVLPHVILGFQSTRPRGRTRHGTWFQKTFFQVSIHASSREDATPVRIFVSADGDVSIHASSREDATLFFDIKWQKVLFQSTRPRGRTRLLALTSLLLIFCFNPRVLAGGRDWLWEAEAYFELVSIHASSREDATGNRAYITSSNPFQSTRPRGRTRHPVF